MNAKPLQLAAVLAGLLLAACGGEEKAKPGPGPGVVSGFEFEITVEPSTFLPAAAEPVRISSDGDPAANPAGTVQLYTPNDTLTWRAEEGETGVFSFDVEVTNFYAGALCAVQVVVDAVTPALGRAFTGDDRGTAYAAGVTGAGAWAYGDLASGAMHARRWSLRLEDRRQFTLRGRVLADEAACGAAAPE